MQADEKTIAQVLTESIKYTIPPYQRPYSWDAENAEQLLTDVQDAFSNKENEYFIGSIITIEKVKDTDYEIVDGQQRLTTLNILLSVLRNNIDAPSAKEDLEKRIRPKNPYTEEPEEARLKLRQQDSSFFERVILDDDKLAIPPKVTETQQRMLDNRNVLNMMLASRDEVYLKRFADFLLNKVYVVFVQTENFESAYRLFNVLNARGMSLSNGDLIKNQLFGKAASVADKKYVEEKWNELEEIIGISGLDYFLGHYRTSLLAEKARSSLHEEFSPLMRNMAPTAFCEDLLRAARNYELIREADFDDAQVKRLIFSLKNVSHDEWIPPLLCYLNNPVEDLSFLDYLSYIDKITMQNWVRRLGRTRRVTVYYNAIKKISAGAAASEISTIFRRHADNDEFCSLISGHIYGHPCAKAVLLRLELESQDHSVTKLYSGRITIEHVLPQTMTDDYWTSRFTEEEHDKWLHRLGNLALLSGNKNSRAQNYNFDKKRAVFEKKCQKVSFDLTKEICAKTEWNTGVIEARHKDLVSLANTIWSIE